jgi:hypothetical protein
MPHAISGGSPGQAQSPVRGAQHEPAVGWGHVQAFKVDDQSAEVVCGASVQIAHQSSLGLPLRPALLLSST